MTDFAKLLNKEQFEAATAGDGPILVLAAAGTGKTRTLTHRVAYLIERGVEPERIMLLTFTNRAAREMRERAEALCGAAAYSIWAGTFHSVCARLLRMYGARLGYKPGFQILDEDDSSKLIADIIKATVADPKDFPKKDIVAKMISEAANEEKPIAAIAARWQTKTAGVHADEIGKIAQLYAMRKTELGVMDFDDLIVKGLELVSKHEDVRNHLQERFRYVMVDEYQDTNSIQAKFTDILAAKHRNIMAVGDDFQCIYTWRGAQIENIIDFPKRWPGCKIVKLERNYRSVKGVLDVANVVMKDATGQFEKTLRPARTAQGALPQKIICFDGRSQAMEIIRQVNRFREAGYRYGDMAILYRSHYQSIDIQMLFAQEKLPHRITSGIGVFEQLHVKDVLSYLRLLVSRTDELGFVRLMRLLPGVGEKSAAKCWQKLSRRFDYRSDGDFAILEDNLPAKAKAYLPQLLAAFADARNLSVEEDGGKIVDSFVFRFYNDHLNREFEMDEADDRLDDIKELAAHIAGSEGGLAGFLADVALLTNLDVRSESDGTDLVTLSTVHQAKGMEWPVVFVPWASEGMFPSQKACDEGRTDEERRLFYVAVTRAKDRLALLSPQIRKMPDGGIMPVKQSPFLMEIPNSLLDVRQVQSAAYAYGRPYAGSGGAARNGGGYGRRPQPPQWKTTWRH